jgi:hypothetical protein
MALIVVLEHHPPAALATVATLVATALAVGLAELYSEVIGATTRLEQRVERHHFRHILERSARSPSGSSSPACTSFSPRSA